MRNIIGSGSARSGHGLRRILAMLPLLVVLIGVGCDFPTTPIPASQRDFQTTQVRYVNLSNSSIPQYLQAGFHIYVAETRTITTNTVRTDTVADFQVSKFFVPLADSAIPLEVRGLKVGALFRPALPLTFTARNAAYTIVGLPPRMGSNAVLDTLLVVTSLPPDPTANTANIRFINCVNDATKTYSFTLGCPSGTPAGSQLGYRASSGVLPIALSGNNLSIALTEQQRPISSTASASPSVQIGLFNISSLSVHNSYSVLLYKDIKGTLRLLAMNDRTSEKINVVTAQQPSTSVRVVNFSGAALGNVTYGAKSIASELGNNGISGYESLSACASAGSDTLFIQRRSGLRQQALSTSLEVNGSQTVFLSDSLAVAAPALTVQPPAGSIWLRVVNLTYVPSTETSSSVSVLRGAVNQLRPQTIVGNLASGQISAPVTVSRESYLPLLVFNNQQPQSLEQFGVVGTMDMAVSAYFLVVTKKQMFLIPDVTAASAPPQTNNLPPLPQGTLIQAVQVFADATTGTAQMRLGAVFSDAVGYGATQITVLPNDKHNIILGSSTRDITTTEGGRLTIIGTGTLGAGRILQEQGLWASPDRPTLPGNALQQGSFRYVNASNDVNFLSIQNDGTSDFQLKTPLKLGEFLPVTRFYKSQSLTFNFKRDTTTLFVARNLLFSVNRAYTVIFAGQLDRSYTVVMMPEY